MYDICCISHITSDKVVTPKKIAYLAGGTSIYFSNAIANMPVRYLLVTSLAEKEIRFANDLIEKGIEVQIFPSKHTVYFENIYSDNLDHRVQKVPQQAEPFNASQLENIDAKIFHLGSLLADDFSLDIIKRLSSKSLVSLDVQGFLRKVEKEDVVAVDWNEKKEALRYVSVLKANEHEVEVLTGEKNIQNAARILYDWGVKEIVITLGSKGSVIYDGTNFYSIPAYKPTVVADATGCGDTYMAGYLYQRVKGASIQRSGEFAAAMATLKIETFGPFTKAENEIHALLTSNV